MDIIKSIEHEQLKNKIPSLKVGDTVKVHQRIKEGNRERIQVFEGIIIKKQGGGINATFTVRRVAYGVGVEKTFLVHSPMMEKVELVRVGKARRAKLYYLRDRVGKAAKTKEAIGARIENKEITLKEEFAQSEEPAEVVENGAEPTEEVATENVDVIETVETPVEAVAVETETATPVSESLPKPKKPSAEKPQVEKLSLKFKPGDFVLIQNAAQAANVSVAEYAMNILMKSVQTIPAAETVSEKETA